MDIEHERSAFRYLLNHPRSNVIRERAKAGLSLCDEVERLEEMLREAVEHVGNLEDELEKG